MFSGNQAVGFRRGCSRGAAFVASVLVGLLGSVQAHAFDASKVKSEFPRLAGMQWGSSPYDGNIANEEYQREIAKLDYAVLNGATENIYAQQIKALNPDIILAKISNIMELEHTRDGVRNKNEILRQKLSSEQGPNTTNAHDWWLRDYDGNHIDAWPGTWRVNITDYVKPDANGLRWPEYHAQFEYDWWMSDPAWDGWFIDVVSWKPRVKGATPDFSGGKVSDVETINEAWRRGNRAYWEAIRKLSPGTLVMVNHDWYNSHDEIEDAQGRINLGYLEGANGGYLEYVMDYDNLRPWEKLFWSYRNSMRYFAEPRLVVFGAQGPEDNYQFFRYAFTLCLMDDGYFDFSSNAGYIKGRVIWFDEFDLAGSATTSWMGKAVTSPPDAPWRNGVYRRDFENAVALLNPHINGEVTVELEDGLYRISGRQDPVVNNGLPAKTVTLKAGDGLVLVRQDPAKAPAKPEAPDVTVE